MEDAVAVARAFGAPVLETLVELDFLDDEEVPNFSIRKVPAEELVMEMQRRTIVARHTLGRLSTIAQTIGERSDISADAKELIQAVDQTLGDYQTGVVVRE